jgi:uncharacterized protein
MNVINSPTSPPDQSSGGKLENLVFGYRKLIVGVCIAFTLLFAFFAMRLVFSTSYERMVPQNHPFAQVSAQYQQYLPGLGNTVRIAVAVKQGDIFTREYLETLRQITDDLYLIRGIDRPYVRGIWMPAVRWTAVTQDGFDGGPLMPDNFDGSAQFMAALRANIARSAEVGQLIAPDFRSTVITALLLERDPSTGEMLDYAKVGQELERLRTKYASKGVDIHVTGFAKVIGDMMEGLLKVLAFFAAAIILSAVILYLYTRCIKSTAMVMLCTLISLVWLLGLVVITGQSLNPYSALVPFLIFAIGVSHGAQKMNGIMQDTARGATRLMAARLTFRRLFVPGLAALLCDVAGFAALLLIDIRAIQDVAIIASLGVFILIFTNLVLLPILLSYMGVSHDAAQRALQRDSASTSAPYGIEKFLVSCTQPQRAKYIVGIAAVMLLTGLWVAQHLQVGDLDAGAPELHPYSRYNRDAAFMSANYGASTDVFVAIGKTEAGQCSSVDNLRRQDAFEWHVSQLPGVVGVNGAATFARFAAAGSNEGQFKWLDIVPDQAQLNSVTALTPRELMSEDCAVMPVYIYLRDHKAETLDQLVRSIQTFESKPNPNAGIQFSLAAGNAGIEAATNQVVKSASREMLLLVYVAVIALCLLVFRSWKGTFAAIIPLVLTSILCEALMVALNIGVKVATLPVIALGVGIGVDYALYVLSIMLMRLRAGDSVQLAYAHSIRVTGHVVIVTAVTLAVGVGLWFFSPIKFQADMGVLLFFMFIWNMIGALVLLPAIATLVFGGRRNNQAHQPVPAK